MRSISEGTQRGISRRDLLLGAPAVAASLVLLESKADGANLEQFIASINESFIKMPSLNVEQVAQTEGFSPIRFDGGLPEIATRYGGVWTDYEWVPGEEGFAARFTQIAASIGNHFINLDPNTVLEGYHTLWTPNYLIEQRIVVGPGQNGINVGNVNFRRDLRPDILYSYILGKRTADTIVENGTRGTNITVIGVNGFRGGEK